VPKKSPKPKGLASKSQVLIGPPKFTRFEKARVIGARALQISMGAPLLVKQPEGVTGSIELASIELQEGVLPITIRRTLPDGKYQDVPIQWLYTE
jgi:DNA-directed RNA polymerase I, II, and III subunit RPABC2